MKAIFIFFISLNLFAGDLTPCEIKILETIKADLLAVGDMPDPTLVSDESENIKYIGDGMFEVYYPVIRIDRPEEWPAHMTWEVSIDARCKNIQAVLVDSYI